MPPRFPRPSRTPLAAARRAQKREDLWPGSQAEVYDLSNGTTAGYTRIPRVVPMVQALINMMGETGVNAGGLYGVLWSYEFGQGYIEAKHYLNMLFEAGYTGKTSRADRTWRERVKVLIDLEFIKTKPSGVFEHGFILLRDPHRVVCDLHRAGRLDRADLSRWWDVFRSRCGDVGVDLKKYDPVSVLEFPPPPPPSAAAPPPPPVPAEQKEGS